jgi:hypothetical protein
MNCIRKGIIWRASLLCVALLSADIGITGAEELQKRPWGELAAPKAESRRDGHLGRYNPWHDTEQSAATKARKSESNPWQRLADEPADAAPHGWATLPRDEIVWPERSGDESDATARQRQSEYRGETLKESKRYLFSYERAPGLHESVRPLERGESLFRESNEYRDPYRYEERSRYRDTWRDSELSRDRRDSRYENYRRYDELDYDRERNRDDYSLRRYPRSDSDYRY